MDDKRLEQAEEEMIESQEHSPGTDAASAADINSESSTEHSAKDDSKAAEELTAEITRLAEAFTNAVRAAWGSEQRKQLETDLNRGLRSLVDNVEETLVKFNRSEQGQELREQAGRVVEKVRTSKVTDDVRDGLTKGLGTVAAELQEFADRMEERRAKENTDAQTEAQDIPVKKDDEG